MSFDPVPDPDPRFTVLTTTGYPIMPSGRTMPHQKPILSAMVYDRFYFRVITTFRSADRLPARAKPSTPTTKRCPECGGRKARGAWLCASCAKERGMSGNRVYGEEGALAAASVRCAELNAWHEREGWGE